MLDKHPVDLRDPAGQADVKLSVQLPLDNKVKMDDIAIRAQAHLDGVHLGDIAAGAISTRVCSISTRAMTG